MPTIEEQLRQRGSATTQGPAGAAALAPRAPRPPAAAAVPARGPASASDMLSRFMPGSTATLRGSGEDASAAVNRGQYGAAAGHIIRGAATLPLAFVNDVVGQPMEQIGFPLAAGVRDAAVTAVTGGIPQAQAQPTPAPRVAAASASAGGTQNAADVLLARGQAPAASGFRGPVSAAQPWASSRDVEGAPGVRRLTTPSGQVLYTNQDDASNRQLMTGRGGTVSVLPAGAGPSAPVGPSAIAGPQVSRGTEAALSAARQAAAARGDWQAIADSYAAQGQTFGAQAGGPASAAQMMRQQFSGRRMTARGAQALADAERNENAAAQTQADAHAKKLQADNGRAIQVAQQRYQQAIADGNAEEIAAAERLLRGLQGSWPSTTQERYNAVPIPGGIDPVTGLARGSGAIVVNQATGEARIIGPDEAKGSGQAKPQWETGKVYRDAQGNQARWDGGKFVPV